MGDFTLTLQEVMEYEHDTGTGLRIGLHDYPIFDKAYRIPLNEKIINHFLLREMAHETIPQFTWALRRKMHEIMPLYNQLYKSTLIDFDPLSTFDLLTERDDTGEEKTETTSDNKTTVKGESTARTVNSDFPQGQLQKSRDYATSATDAESGSESDTTGEGSTKVAGSNTLAGKSRTTGRQGNPSQMILDFRATMINTDMVVVAELNECFFGLYSNGDELMPQRQLPGRGYYGFAY